MRSINFPFSVLVLLFLVGVLVSCKKEKTASEIPSIEFLEAPIIGDTIAVKFHFIDGDGDIGFNPGDTLPPFDCQEDEMTGLCTNINASNVRMVYFEFENGEWFAPDPQPGVNYRLNTITPDGQDKYLEGDLTCHVGTALNIFSPSNDSIKFEIVLVDRALNMSNTIETSLILNP